MLYSKFSNHHTNVKNSLNLISQNTGLKKYVMMTDIFTVLKSELLKPVMVTFLVAGVMYKGFFGRCSFCCTCEWLWEVEEGLWMQRGQLKATGWGCKLIIMVSWICSLFYQRSGGHGRKGRETETSKCVSHFEKHVSHRKTQSGTHTGLVLKRDSEGKKHVGNERRHKASCVCLALAFLCIALIWRSHIRNNAATDF